MSDTSSKISNAAKELLSLSKDALIVGVAGTFLFYPSHIKHILQESGLSKLSAFGVSVELKEEEKKLAQAQTEVTSKNAAAAAGAGDTPAEASNRPVDPDFLKTVQDVARTAPQLLPRSGWVFLGRVTEDKARWTEGGSVSTTAAWPVKPEDVVTVRSDVYVRADSNDKWRSSAPITSVAKVGDRLKVVQLDYSPARSGGLYAWAKVAIQPQQ